MDRQIIYNKFFQLLRRIANLLDLYVQAIEFRKSCQKFYYEYYYKLSAITFYINIRFSTITKLKRNSNETFVKFLRVTKFLQNQNFCKVKFVKHTELSRELQLQFIIYRQKKKKKKEVRSPICHPLNVQKHIEFYPLAESFSVTSRQIRKSHKKNRIPVAVGPGRFCIWLRKTGQ